jgi:hypothetical protein
MSANNARHGVPTLTVSLILFGATTFIPGVSHAQAQGRDASIESASRKQIAHAAENLTRCSVNLQELVSRSDGTEQSYRHRPGC